jgi:hypothetical protein
VTIDAMRDVGTATWAESMMETKWLKAGHDQRSLQEWLRAADEESCPGFDTRRDALESEGGVNLLWQLLNTELSS